ncbi:DNA gyrase/topoisomerase IV subunit A [Serinicoccus sp. LYQ131]|uniref:DNA gyrase/topoisomerase IV subunit A n=1 Tax=Serinicoccus sp. LYQ131 TaxID=3378797 RepID=UPI003851B3C3
MARRKRPQSEDLFDVEEKIIDVDVQEEMEGAFLEYAYSVIYSRALPDARDGLKPVQRRILFGMRELGLRPDKAHVKCSRVVGEVMGKYHPHGDTAIYDAMVRMAQPFTMRLPLVDGHGNFGSLDDGPAASRYTEARMAPAALLMTGSLDESTVDFVPNYDDQLLQPEVLPAAYPNLLVNGATGIAVGMATNMPPHNLVEVIGAARHLIAHPEADLEALMRFVPGPDLPLGGRIVGLDGIRDAYESGRGSFRTRATARIENVTPRKKGIVVTDLPYTVGPEKVIEKVKQLVQSKKLQGISDIIDLTDRTKGLHLVIEIKTGFNPDAVLEQLYKLTPMEESFGINNVALVEGQPRTLGLRELLAVYVDFRTDVVRRRTAHRLAKKQDRLHLVEGLLIAILDIDEVIQLIRAAEDVGTARERLMQVFDLTEIQANHILDLQLRRLTKFSRIELESERDELRREIEALQAILGDEALLRTVVSQELAEVAAEHGTPRRTVLLESDGSGSGGSAATSGRNAATGTTAGMQLEVADDPCWVLLSSTGLLARTSGADSEDEADGEGERAAGRRAKHDVITARVRATARGEVGLLTSAGRVVRLSVVELPALPPSADAPNLSGGAPVSAFVDMPPGEQVLGLCTLGTEGQGLVLGTRQGVVKRVNPDYPSRDSFEVISLKDGDSVVGALELATGEEEVVFITSEAHLLRYSASLVRPQGRSGGGVAGIKLGAGGAVVGFTAVDTSVENVVVTVAGSAASPPATQTGTVKVTDLWAYPTKGRATGGVRCHRLLKGEDALILGWAGAAPPRAASGNGVAVELPETNDKRDGSGVPAAAPIASVG